MDFFFQNLDGENCLVVPPVCVIARAVRHMFLHKITGTVVVPVWPSSAFWPLLMKTYGGFIEGYFEREGSFALELGRNVNSLLGSSSFLGYVAAIRFKFG